LLGTSSNKSGERLGGNLRLLACLGHHEGDRIAHMAYFPLRQRRVRRLFHRQAVLAGNAPAARQSADAGSLQVFAGEHAEHARHGQRRGRVDRLDRGVGMRRAHEHAHHHVGPLDVGDVIAAPGQETLILFAQRPLADTDDIGHGHAPCSACIAAVPRKTDVTMF
jgi:hypothetical protein